MASELYEKIKNIVGEERVTESDFEKLFYSSDVSPLSPKLIEELGTIPDIIARPKNAEEVSQIIKIAAQKKTSIVPRGGASWWLGGSIPYKGGIVLDLTSMNATIKIDEENLTVTVDCGVTWEELEDVLRMKSLFLGTRPGSAASATVGGWISTGGSGFNASTSQDVLPCIAIYLFALGSVIFAGFGGGLYCLTCFVVNAICRQ